MVMTAPNKPTAKAGPAPAPPAQPQKPVNGAAQPCPHKEKIPCDCQKLTVTAVVSDYGTTKTRKLFTAKKKRGAPIAGEASKKIVELLGRYDFVIDMVAGYRSREDPNPDKVTLTAHGEFIGQHCGYSVHPAMDLKGLGPTPELPHEFVKKGTDLGPMEFTATEADQDLKNVSGIGVIIDIIKSFWPLSQPKQLEVKQLACGIRPAGAGGVPAPDLIALVRIFRHDKYAVGLKMPPLCKFSQESAGTVTGEREYSRERKTSSLFNHNSKESSTEIKGDEYKYKSETRHGASGSGVDYKSDGTTSSMKMIHELEKTGKGFAFFIRRNGREFSKEIKPGEKKSLFDKILDGVEKAITALSKLYELFHKMPQLGWKFTFEISLLEGELALEWEPKYVDAPRLDGRYFPVTFRFAGVIGMNIVGIKADLSFGIDAQACGTGIVLKVGGYVSLNLPVQAEFALEEHKPKVEINLRPEAKASIYGEGKASVFGVSVADAHADVTACFDMQDGKLEFSLEHCMELKGHLKSEKMMLTGFVKFVHTPPKRLTPRLIIDEFPIYTFG